MVFFPQSPGWWPQKKMPPTSHHQSFKGNFHQTVWLFWYILENYLGLFILPLIIFATFCAITDTFLNCLDISSLGPLRHIQRQDWSTFYESDALTCQKSLFSISLVSNSHGNGLWNLNKFQFKSCSPCNEILSLFSSINFVSRYLGEKMDILERYPKL